MNQKMGSRICPLPFNPLSLVYVFSLFLVILQLSFLSARAHKFADICGHSQPSSCGNLNISYPFSFGGCGLETILCINDSTRTTPLLFYDKEYSTYAVHSINYTTNTMLAHDRRFTEDWQSDDEKCKALFNNYTMPPIFRYLSAQLITPNLTLRVCKRRSSTDDCKIEALPADDTPPPASSSFQRRQYDCKLVHLPVDVPKNSTFQHGHPVDHVSQLLSRSVGFIRLRWSLPQICHQCQRNRTVCYAPHPTYDNRFCINPKDGWNQDKAYKSQKQIIQIGIPVGVVGGILLASFVFFIFYKYRMAQNLGQVRRFISLKTDLEKGSTHFGVAIFSYAELEEATNNFSSTNELGDGGYGTVYQGKLRDGRVVAIKRLYPKNSNKHLERFMNEIEILTRLRHQNLVVLYGCTSYYSRELLLVYECIPNGTVADHLHGHRMMVGSLPWPVRMSIAVETASALSYLHASGIIHRDVKTRNILLDNHFHVKVADFGLCCLFPIDASYISTAPQGTPGYVDPEYHRSYQLTNKSDVYSFGVVLIELISSKPAVDITRHQDEINLANMALNKIQNGALQELVDPCLGFETDCNTRTTVTVVAELAFRCLQQERELRPSMDEVLEILTASVVDKDYKMDNAAKVVDNIIASYDVESLKNTPPSAAASPDFTTTNQLISEQQIPSTNIG